MSDDFTVGNFLHEIERLKADIKSLYEEVQRLKAVLERIKQGPVAGEYEWKRSWAHRIAAGGLEKGGSL